MRRSTGEALWQAVYAEFNAIDGYKRPTTISPPLLTTLLFDEVFCFGCGTYGSKLPERPRTWWRLRTQLCYACLAAECTTAASLLRPGVDVRLRHVVPSMMSQLPVSDSKGGGSKVRLIVRRADVQAASRKLGSLDNDGWRERFETVLADFRLADAETNTLTEHAATCDWQRSDN